MTEKEQLEQVRHAIVTAIKTLLAIDHPCGIRLNYITAASELLSVIAKLAPEESASLQLASSKHSKKWLRKQVTDLSNGGRSASFRSANQ